MTSVPAGAAADRGELDWRSGEGVVLQGRAAERAALDELLAAAQVRRSGSAILTGDPGIGKSTLLTYVRERAGDVRVLSARGYESETEIPFAGLAELLRPVLDLIPALPARQAAALNSALSMGPAVPGDRFSVCAATLSLLAAVAEGGPLLVIIDDLHWLDDSSRTAVLFTARRLNAEGVALIMASRTTSDPATEYAGIRRIRVGALTRSEANRLIRGTSLRLSAESGRRIYDDVAGNPLGIRELCDELARRSSSPDLLPVGPAPAAMPADSRLGQAMAGRISQLPDSTKDALLVAAAAAGAERDVVVTAAQRSGLGLADFAAAEDAGLLRIDAERVEFRHPLLRSAMYGSASSHARARAHEALASTLEEIPGDAAADARAWHLASARMPPDEDTARVLTEAGRRARRRSGYLESARCYQQAARFSPLDEQAALLFGAARMLQLAGRGGEILDVLSRARAVASDPRQVAQIRHMAAYTRIWLLAPDDVPKDAVSAQSEIENALADLVAGSAEIAGIDDDRAAFMVTDAAIACYMLARLDEGVELVARARRLGAFTSGETQSLLAVAGAAIFAAKGRRAEAKALLDASLDALLGGNPVARAQELAHANFAAIWLEDYALADRLVSRLLAWARDRGVVGMVPMVLAAASELSFRLGDWSLARAQAEESVELALQVGQLNLYGQVYLARLDGLQGRGADCVTRTAKIEQGVQQLGSRILRIYSDHTLGLMALGQGRLPDAVAHLETARDHAAAAGLGEPSVVPWAFDLVEAYLRSGRTTQAQDLLSEVSPEPGDETRGWAQAAAARCRGLLTPRSGVGAGSGASVAAAEFELALHWHDRSGQPFERARTLLCAGERLRRERQRGVAQRYLRQALELFESLDALDWAERTRVELVATGENPVPGSGPKSPLTPQELQVALVVAEGASNQEAAAALFLSPKTIEYHLSNVYRKLGVSSRAELAVLRPPGQ